MKTAVRAIARHPAALGLGLAGVHCTEVETGDDAAAAIAAAGAGTGVILIEQSLFDALPAAVRRKLRKDGVPILMPFPGPALGAPAAGGEDELLEILRRSIGYRLRLR